MGLSRIWQLNGYDSLDDLKQLIFDNGSDMNKLPIKVQGSLLD